MSLIVWLGWRLLQRGQGTPQRRWFWMGIVLAATLFGVNHLPAAIGFGMLLTLLRIGFIVLFNTFISRVILSASQSALLLALFCLCYLILAEPRLKAAVLRNHLGVLLVRLATMGLYLGLHSAYRIDFNDATIGEKD